MNDPFGDLGAAPPQQSQDPFADLRPGFWDYQRKALSEAKPEGALQAEGAAVKGLYDWWAQNAHDRNAKFAHAMKGMERGGDPTEMNEMSRQEAFGLATGPVGELGVIGKGANAALSFGAPASAKEFATGLSDALFGLNNQTRAERTLLRQHLEKIPNIPQE